MTAPATHADKVTARILVQAAAANATTVDELRALARDANAAGAWGPTVRRAFTRRRLALEGGGRVSAARDGAGEALAGALEYVAAGSR